MDIDSYIELHQADWRELEAAVNKGFRGLSRMSGPEINATVGQYLRVSGHLSEVRARYRDRELEDYLNRLVSQSHAAIYSSSNPNRRSVLQLFGRRYRAAFQETFPFILASAVLFLTVVFLVQLWIAASPEAQEGLVPPFAREAVRQATGDRAWFGIPSAGISTYILFNNVQVSLLAFASGILLGLGTVFIVVHNAVFIGLLAGAFQAGGKADIFWSLVVPHGILEITAICIAAGAGLRMGWSIVDPGDRPRSRALAEESAQSVLVVIGIIPAFAIAAFIEGFITGTDLPNVLEITIGIVAAVSYWLFLAGRGWLRAARNSLRSGTRRKPPLPASLPAHPAP